MSFPAIDNQPPINVGEFLRDELEAINMSVGKFATHIGEPGSVVTEIIDGTKGISGLMALKLSRAFGTTPQYWLNLQNMYETKDALAKYAGAIEMVRPLPTIQAALGSDTSLA